MSFQNTSTWKFNASSSRPDEAMSYDTSTQIIPKCGFYQWLMTASDEEVEQFNKMEDVESVKEPGIINDPISDGNYNNSYMVQASNHVPNNFQMVQASNNVPNNFQMVQASNNVPNIAISTSSSAALNIQNTRDFENHFWNDPNTDLTMYHDPSILKARNGKSKVNEAAAIFENLKPDQFVGTSSTRVENKFPNTELCLGSTFYTGDGNTISLAPTFPNIDRGVSSVGETLNNKKDGDSMVINQYSNGMVINQYSNGIPNHMLYGINQPFNKGYNNVNAVLHPYGRVTGNIMMPNAITYNVHGQSSRNDNSGDDQSNEKKMAKTDDRFPSNVKSLLSTGLLEGVPVKYISWSRGIQLRGVLNGTGYLCSCTERNLSKCISANEFERHAGCNGKHSNNNIYFENGKTIAALVQQLKNTPYNMFSEVIQNVTGSPVNQKNFDAWKASHYRAATSELERFKE